MKADYSYAESADVLFVYVKNNKNYEEKIPLDPITHVIDSKGYPVALEILDASKVLKTNKLSLR